MMRINTLFTHSLFKIEKLDHPPQETYVDGSTSLPREYCVTFLQSGEFRVVRNGKSWELSAGDMILCYPLVPQQVFHPGSLPRDECVSIRFSAGGLEDMIGSAPMPHIDPKRAASAKNEFHLWRIRRALEDRDSLQLEGIALNLAQLFVSPGGQSTSWSAIDRNLAWYRLRIARVCQFLTYNYADESSLTSLSALAGISPFHFNRVFHYLTGVPLHQYSIKLRVVAAAKAMRAGRSVSDAAFEAGFTSAAYFSRCFRRQFGIAPREFRKLKQGAAFKKALPEQGHAFVRGAA